MVTAVDDWLKEVTYKLISSERPTFLTLFQYGHEKVDTQISYTIYDLQNEMTQIEIKSFSSYIPRQNLPAKFTAQSSEDNFVDAFREVYISRQKRRGIYGKEFALEGFGIADFVHAQYENVSRRNPCKIGVITAFEMKLKDWKRAVSQAYRYTYFADRAIVVIPPKQARGAKANLEVLKKLGLGVWVFDKDSMKIHKLITPHKTKAKLTAARKKTCSILADHIK